MHSSAQAIRNQPAARLPPRQARNTTTSVKIALPRNMRLPTVAMSGARPMTRRTFEAASPTNATASQPKARYTRGENSRRLANSRTNRAEAAALMATGTFQA